MVAGLSDGVGIDVRRFVIDEVRKHIDELEAEIREGSLHTALLTLVVGGGGADTEGEDEGRALVAPVTALLQACAARSALNRRTLFDPSTLSTLLSSAGVPSPQPSTLPPSVDPIRLLRVFSFYVDLACADADSLTLFLDSTLPALLLSSLSSLSFDPLTQLNIVELLRRLVQRSPHLSAQLAGEVLHALFAASSSARPALLTVATLQVAESMAEGRAEGEWWRDDSLIHSLQAGVEDVDETVQLQAVMALCTVSGVSLDSLVLLMPLLLKHLPTLVTSTSELVQLSALHGLTRVFASTPTPPSAAPAVLSLKEELWAAIGAYHRKAPIAVLQSVLHTPFHSQRMAVLGLLRAVGGLESVGVLNQLVSPGWVEWLLDRGTEVELEGLRGKWEVLEAIAKNPKAAEMNADTLRLIREYVRQGPVWVARQVTVMNPLTSKE